MAAGALGEFRGLLTCLSGNLPTQKLRISGEAFTMENERLGLPNLLGLTPQIGS